MKVDLLRWVALASSSVLIAASARGDLWFDEIWSIEFARLEARSVFGVFRILHDNNHPLNTLYLFLIGDVDTPIAYRAHAVLAGILSVYLCGVIARRQWGALEALFATVLVGFSHPLVVYFSEARGYAMAVLFSLCAFALWIDECIPWSRRRFLLFWGSSALGILAHATCMLPVAAMAVSDLLRRLAPSSLPRRAWRELAWQHGPGLLVSLAWYGFFLRRMAIGGSDPQFVWPELLRGWALVVGVPIMPAAAIAALVAILGYAGCSGLGIDRAIAPHWRFYPVLVAGAAVIAVAASRTQTFQFRYLVIIVPFLYLLAARSLGVCCQSEQRSLRWAAISLLGLSLLGHSANDRAFLRTGRGSYEAAMRTMLERSPVGAVLVGSDHDFRQSLILDFYGRRIPGGAAFRYVRQSSWRAMPPDWFIVHTQDLNARPAEQLELPYAGAYRLSRPVYEYSGVSGWRWFVYERLR